MTESSRSTEPPYAALAPPARARLIAFLSSRLTEDLARIWPRATGDRGGPRPGMVAQLGVVDDLLRTLGLGRLPARPDLRMLLYGYGHHPDYDPQWTALVHD